MRTKDAILSELAAEQAKLASLDHTASRGYARGEAPLGFAEPVEDLTIEYDYEALRHFEDDL